MVSENDSNQTHHAERAGLRRDLYRRRSLVCGACSRGTQVVAPIGGRRLSVALRPRGLLRRESANPRGHLSTQARLGDGRFLRMCSLVYSLRDRSEQWGCRCA